jgi:hypothetical protein
MRTSHSGPPQRRQRREILPRALGSVWPVCRASVLDAFSDCLQRHTAAGRRALMIAADNQTVYLDTAVRPRHRDQRGPSTNTTPSTSSPECSPTTALTSPPPKQSAPPGRRRPPSVPCVPEYDTIASADRVARHAAVLDQSGLSAGRVYPVRTSEAFGPLTAAFADADVRRLNLTKALPKLIAGRGIADADDTAAILHHRVNRRIVAAGRGADTDASLNRGRHGTRHPTSPYQPPRLVASPSRCAHRR